MTEFDASAEKTKRENGGPAATQPGFLESATEFLRHAVIFICYGPGVLGLLWLIGRILRR